MVESFNKFFNQVEQIKKFELLPYEWTVDAGEMTQPKTQTKSDHGKIQRRYRKNICLMQRLI